MPCLDPANAFRAMRDASHVRLLRQVERTKNIAKLSRESRHWFYIRAAEKVESGEGFHMKEASTGWNSPSEDGTASYGNCIFSRDAPASGPDLSPMPGESVRCITLVHYDTVPLEPGHTRNKPPRAEITTGSWEQIVKST